MMTASGATDGACGGLDRKFNVKQLGVWTRKTLASPKERDPTSTNATTNTLAAKRHPWRL